MNPIDIPNFERRRLVLLTGASTSLRFAPAPIAIATLGTAVLTVSPVYAGGFAVVLAGIADFVRTIVALLSTVFGRQLRNDEIDVSDNEPSSDDWHDLYRDSNRVVRMPQTDAFSLSENDAIARRSGANDPSASNLNRGEGELIRRACIRTGGLFRPIGLRRPCVRQDVESVEAYLRSQNAGGRYRAHYARDFVAGAEPARVFAFENVETNRPGYVMLHRSRLPIASV